ncbi:hypothetical protein [Zwartia sp.]|uniref:hypothetical protein n=1 Tax=Zwartia sp. TaxID=2978004 RepID=UPI003BAE5C80
MKNRHSGSSLDEWLKDEGLLEDVSAEAMRRVFIWKKVRPVKSDRSINTQWLNALSLKGSQTSPHDH